MGNSKNSHKLTREEKEKAVELAIGGKDPLSYLRERGAQNPSAAWWYIKKTLAKSNPKLLEKIPEKLGTVLDEKGQAVPADDSEAADPLEGFTAFDPGAPEGNPAAPTGNPAAPTGNPAAPTGNPAAMVSSTMDPGAPESPRDRAKRILDDLFRFPENVTAEQNPAGRVVVDKNGVHMEPPKEPKNPDWEKTTFFGIPCEVTGMKAEGFEFSLIGDELMVRFPGAGLVWTMLDSNTMKLPAEQWRKLTDLVPKVMKILRIE